MGIDENPPKASPNYGCPVFLPSASCFLTKCHTSYRSALSKKKVKSKIQIRKGHLRREYPFIPSLLPHPCTDRGSRSFLPALSTHHPEPEIIISPFLPPFVFPGTTNVMNPVCMRLYYHANPTRLTSSYSVSWRCTAPP